MPRSAPRRSALPMQCKRQSAAIHSVMTAQKVDVEISDLSKYQLGAGCLRTGEEVNITLEKTSSQLQVHAKQGQQVGVIKDEKHRELLINGVAVVRSIRRQQNLVVQLLLRVTHAPKLPVQPRGDFCNSTVLTVCIIRLLAKLIPNPPCNQQDLLLTFSTLQSPEKQPIMICQRK